MCCQFEVEIPSSLQQPAGEKWKTSALALLSGLSDACHGAADAMSRARKLFATASCC